jgi:hypothetical protein
MPAIGLLHRGAIASVLLALCGCAALSPAPQAATAQCRSYFEQLDARVAQAGVHDGHRRRVPGYPYLRVDRFLASFADEVDADAAFGAWLRQLRAADRDARAVELRRLGEVDVQAELARVDRCGETLAALELATPPQRARLRARARVGDDYSLVARTLGFYPFAVPFLNLGISGYHDEVRDDYATPLDALDSPGPLVVWTADVAATETGDAALAGTLADAPRDALGIPQLDAAQWQRLAALHAPVWWIETGGDYDLPGVPAWRGDGTPTVDPAQAVTYFLPQYTRFGREVLPALVYVVWFSERPPQKSFDPYAGALDGVVWRVVLDPQGRPLAYDTIHSCGCYRYSFAAQPLERIAHGGFWQEPVLLPQADVPAGRPALRIQSQTHYVRRVVAADGAAGERRRYTLRPYDALLSLPDGRGGTRSLFAADGLVDGSERAERWWLWISGVYEPGAMRQWGRHATAFVGRSHFDDARFLEQSFAVPDWAR